MRLLGTETYRNALSECLGEANSELIILSAFVTVPGFKWIVDSVKKYGITGKLVVRWHPEDLLSGASSLEVYHLAKQAGWDVYIYRTLHAKSVLVDRNIVFVGSANMTGYGLSMVPEANLELGAKFEATLQDVIVFETIISESTFVTDSIIEIMTEFLSSQPARSKQLSRREWPSEIEKMFKRPPEKLWVADLFWSSPDDLFNLGGLDDDIKKFAFHDLDILGLSADSLKNVEYLGLLFSQSRAWKWLERLLLEAEGHELYFGTITETLHNALLDDPKPYRRDVKVLVQNLYLWLQVMPRGKVKIDIPAQRSQRIRYFCDI
jgi:hypothetical protein